MNQSVGMRPVPVGRTVKIINPLPEDAMYVYHYTSSATALNHILKNGKLKFNPFCGVNDPRESKHWDMGPMVDARCNLSLGDYEKMSRELSDILKANAKLVCFSLDRPKAAGAWQPQALPSRGFAKPSMWHHYGGKHDGICLMFDKAKLDTAFRGSLASERLTCGKVEYSNRGILPRISADPFIIDLRFASDKRSYVNAIRAHLAQWFPELFMRKLADWAVEDEYRWIYLDTTDQPIFVDFGPSLEAVVVGERVSPEHNEAILRHCVRYEAELASLTWNNGFPRIEGPTQPYITHRDLL